MITLAEARDSLRSDEEELRRAAVARLGPPSDSGEAAAALEFLVEAMGDTSWRVRKEAAARAAAWHDPAAAAAVLTTALAEPENVGRRNAVVESLVALGSHALPALIAALEARPEHRKLIADALGLIGDLHAGAALAPLIDDEDANVRVAAAEALGHIGGSAARAALTRALARGELLLSQAALEGLNRLGAALERAQLEPLLATPTLRAATLEALGRTGDRAVLGILAEAFSDPARSTREAAIRALAELYRRLPAVGREIVALDVAARKDAFQSLTGALLEASLGTQRDAALLLGMLKRPEAARPLVLALGDPELRESAMQALAMIGAPAAETLAALAPDLESTCAPTPTRSCRGSARRRPTSACRRCWPRRSTTTRPRRRRRRRRRWAKWGTARRWRRSCARSAARRRSRTRPPTRSVGWGRAITTKCASSCRAAGSAAPTRPTCAACWERAGAPRMPRSCGRRWAPTSPRCAARRPRRWRSCRPASTSARR